MAKELRIITASGTNYEIGFKIGRSTSTKINKILQKTAYVNKVETAAVKKLYGGFMKIVQKRYPQYLEEIHGMADGAGVDFRKLMKLNLPELKMLCKREQPAKTRKTRKKRSHSEYDDCTTLVLNKEDRILVAHNEDGSSDSDIFLLRAKLPSGVAVLGICSYGVLCGFAATINSEGVFITCDSLECNAARIGIPKRFITRAAIEARTKEEVFKIITDKDRAQGQDYVICVDNHAWNAEVATLDHEIKEIKGKFAHANNFLSKKLLKFEAKKDKKVGTFLRSQFAQREIKKAETFNDLRKMLSSHENRPSCVCAHGKEAGDYNKTLAIVLYDSSRPRRMNIGYGFTCQATIKEFSLR